MFLEFGGGVGVEEGRRGYTPIQSQRYGTKVGFDIGYAMDILDRRVFLSIEFLLFCPFKS